MSTDDTDGTTRRNVLQKGALLGSALAMGAIGGAAGDTGDGATSASVGALQGTVYQWSSGPDGNGYAGPNSARSNVSADTGDVFIGWDSGAEKLFRGDGSSWVELADFSAIGTASGSGSVPQVGDPYDALIVQNDPTDPGNTDYTYSNSGRRGTAGETTASDLSAALAEFYTDYSGGDDANLEDTPGVAMLSPGVHIPQNEIFPDGRSCYVVGPRYLHRRDVKGGPNDVGGGTDEIICAIWSRDLATSESIVNAATVSDPTAFGFGYLSFIGDNREQDLINLENTNKTVFEDCNFAETNGRALRLSGAFAAVHYRCDVLNCGQYDSGAGIDNAALLAQEDPNSLQNSNLKWYGGKLRTEETDGGTQIRSPQGGVFFGGGDEASVKYEGSNAIPAVEGTDMEMFNFRVTGENGPGIGIRINGGRTQLNDVHAEKLTTGFDIQGIEADATRPMGRITARSNSGDGINLGTLDMTFDQITAHDNGGSAIYVESGVGNFADIHVTSGRFSNNTNYVFEDDRSGSTETSTIRFDNCQMDSVGTGVFNDPRYVSHYSGNLTAIGYAEVTISSGTTSGTAAHGLYQEWDPIAATVTPTNANGIGDVVDVTSVDTDSDGYNEDVQVTVGSAPSADTDVKVTVFSEVVRGGDVAPGGTSTL